MARFPFSALSLSLTLLAAGPAAALDWPQFRGVNRDGVSAETDLPRSWPAEGPRVVWKRAIGEGYSGVSVAGDRLYTMDSDGTAEYVLALEAGSGKELWRVPAGPKLIDSMGNGPRTTPTLDDGTVYAMGSHGRLLALKAADGAKIWEMDLPQAFGAKRPNWGYSGSPLIDGDLLILEVGGKDGRGVVAFEKATGKVRWGALDGDAAYSSPVVMTIGGIKQYVVPRRAGSQTVAFRPDGSVLWTHPGPFSVIASALFIPPDKVYISGGDDAGAVLMRIKTESGKATVEELWQTRAMKNHFNNAVLVGGHLYGFDNATFKCLSVATGEQTWASRGLGKGSLLAADGNLLIVLSDQGTLLLVEATPGAYTERARFQAMEGKAWTAPTLANGRLYLRDHDEIVALEMKAPGARGASASATPAPKGETTGTSRPPATPTLSLEEIVARYEAARGSRERWRALRSIEMEGTFTSFSEEAPFTLRRKRPNLYRFDSRMTRKEMILAQGAQGPWWLYPLYGIDSPARVEESPVVVMTARDAEIEPALFGYQEKGHKVVLAGRGDVSGQETLRLELTRSNGWVETWHLDPRTYLEVAVDSKVFDYSQLPQEMQERAYFSDFRTVDGLVIPHRIEKEYGARHTLTRVERIRVNPEVEDRVFAMPATSSSTASSPRGAQAGRPGGVVRVDLPSGYGRPVGAAAAGTGNPRSRISAAVPGSLPRKAR
ncbi:MAG TPA: PQQ-binding-like beta-propeller repeat protein [Thermoanaerobaculia bacterium]|nr:PQQ-binding-like beta-propeller repeat protein [Thermoanaerobaculia bacterium]